MAQVGLMVSNTTNSTSPSTGAAIIKGGIGVSLDVNIGGILSVTSLKNEYTKVPHSFEPIFDMNRGMVYSLLLLTSTFTSITFANIPLEPLLSHTFTFIIEQPTPSDLFYLVPPLNIINIIGNNLTRYTPTCFGNSNIYFNATQKYIIQQYTIMNEGTLTVPSFIVLTSASGY